MKYGVKKMNFKNTWTGNWEGAFRGMRHPMESYSKSDSDFGIAENDAWLNEVINDVAYSYIQDKENYEEEEENAKDWLYENGVLYWGKNAADYVFLGPNDLDLAQRLIKAGTPHDKFLRQIFVSVDITAPLYVWKELDQYKIGTVTDSQSTMHKLATTSITKECFEMGDCDGSLKLYDKEPYNIDDMWDNVINYCETLRIRFLETKDKRYWKELIRILPASWLQTRQWTANYSVVRAIVKQRDGHRLSEWESFMKWAYQLPYANELLFI